MKKFMKFVATALSLCLCVGALGAFASCNKEPETPAPKTEEVAVSVKNELGTAVANIEVVIYDDDDDSEAAKVTTNAEGKASATLEVGGYYATIDREALPDRHYFLDYKNTFSFEVKEGETNALDITVGYLEEVVYDGSAANPYPLAQFLAQDGETYSLKLPAGAEYYYTTWNMDGSELWISDSRVSVIYDGVTYEYNTALGAVTVSLAQTESTGRVTFKVKNNAQEEITVSARWEAVAGTESNPYELSALENVSVALTGGETVYYKWTATAAGTLSVTSVTPVQQPEPNEDQPYGVVGLKKQGGSEETDSVTVAAGDVVLVAVSMRGTLVETSEYNATFTLGFVEDNA